jgi:threonine dehydrogenase-like Zn-dependent dehydrogenase
MNKGITFRMGQTHVPRYTKPLLEKIQSGAIDPSFVITIASRSTMPQRLQDVSGQGRRLHQGGPQAIADFPWRRRSLSW